MHQTSCIYRSFFFKGKYIINEDQVPAQDRQRPVREGTKPRRRIQTVTARAFGDPGTITSRSSPTPFTIGVFAFRKNRTHVLGINTLLISFPLPIEVAGDKYIFPKYQSSILYHK
jgi:hypothetical protein